MFISLKIDNLTEIENNAREVLRLVEALNKALRERPISLYLSEDTTCEKEAQSE